MSIIILYSIVRSRLIKVLRRTPNRYISPITVLIVVPAVSDHPLRDLIDKSGDCQSTTLDPSYNTVRHC